MKLSGIPSRAVTSADLDGKVVAIDAPNLMYAFYAAQLRDRDITPDAHAAALRAATRGLATRVADLARFGARSVVVFDGPPHEMKRAHLEERAVTRSVPSIAPDEYAFARDAAKALGAPVIDAPHDAEAQASAMARRGLVDVVATTDWDALAMGAPVLLRNLSAHPDSTDAGRRWSVVRAEDALARLGVDLPTLASLCVLMGCDYYPGHDGVGPAKAAKLLAQHPTLDAALVALGATPEQRALATRAHALLHAPPSRDAQLRWGAHDAAALLRALHGEAPVRKLVQTKL